MRAPHVMHGKTSEITHTGVGVFAGLAEPAHRDAVPLTRRRTRLRARRARDHGRVRRRSGDGSAPPRVPDRGRAVPPRVDPHRVGPLAVAELPATGKVRAPARDFGEAVVEERRERFAVELDRSAPSPRASAPSTSPRRCRNDPSYAACRCWVSPASAPCVAQHASRSGTRSQRGLRAVHTVAPRSISASSRSRPRNGAAIATAAASASRSSKSFAAHTLAHAPDVDLDADRVGVVGLGRDRGRGVTADARRATRGRRASRSCSIRRAASHNQRARRG